MKTLWSLHKLWVTAFHGLELFEAAERNLPLKLLALQKSEAAESL
jgi:hypothetical protein